MKVKALDTIAGYYGVKTAGEEFEIRAGEGQALIDAGRAELVNEADTPADEPKQGQDMTHIRKAEKVVRQTKEEKNDGSDNK